VAGPRPDLLGSLQRSPNPSWIKGQGGEGKGGDERERREGKGREGDEEGRGKDDIPSFRLSGHARAVQNRGANVQSVSRQCAAISGASYHRR